MRSSEFSPTLGEASKMLAVAAVAALVLGAEHATQWLSAGKAERSGSRFDAQCRYLGYMPINFAQSMVAPTPSEQHSQLPEGHEIEPRRLLGKRVCTYTGCCGRG